MKAIWSFGEAATAAFLVSVVSGFVIAMQYEPAVPFLSTVAIEAELPFGAFWRALHFWSSQLFMILLCLHIFQRTDRLPRMKGEGAVPLSGRRRWFITGFTLPVSVVALFTGYVLRFDGTGQAAGAIAEHLMKNIPLVGESVNRMLLAVEREGVNRVYAVHMCLAAICWGIGTWYHTGRVIVKRNIFFAVLSASVLWSALINAPIDLPGINSNLIKGPWFFVGVQELLRDLPPLYAGIIFPAIPVAVILGMPWIRDVRNGFFILAVWGAIYTVFTVMGFARV